MPEFPMGRLSGRLSASWEYQLYHSTSSAVARTQAEPNSWVTDLTRPFSIVTQLRELPAVCSPRLTRNNKNGNCQLMSKQELSSGREFITNWNESRAHHHLPKVFWRGMLSTHLDRHLHPLEEETWRASKQTSSFATVWELDSQPLEADFNLFCICFAVLFRHQL